jgi:hypothetical protein
LPAQREARELCDARAAAARYKLHRAARPASFFISPISVLTRALAISHPRPTDIAHPLSLIAADNTMNGDAPPPHTSADPVLASGAAPTGDLKLDTSAPAAGAGHVGEASTASAAPLSADAAPTSPPIGTTTTTTITTTTSAAPDAASPTAGSVPGSAIAPAGTAPGSAIHPAAGSEAAPAPSSTLAAVPAAAAAGGAAGAVAGESDKDKAAVAAPPPIAPKEAKKYDKLLKVSWRSVCRTHARGLLGDEPLRRRQVTPARGCGNAQEAWRAAEMFVALARAKMRVPCAQWPAAFARANLCALPSSSSTCVLTRPLYQTEAKNDEKELAAAIKQAAADEKTLRKARKAEAQSIKVRSARLYESSPPSLTRSPLTAPPEGCAQGARHVQEAQQGQAGAGEDVCCPRQGR